MPPDPAEVLQLVCSALEQFLRDTRRPVPDGGVLADTTAYGPDGLLDSLGLVGFVADVEARMAEAYGRDVILADERAMSRRRSPFRSPRTLTELVCERLAERNAGP